jgi:hypothetical protein
MMASGRGALLLARTLTALWLAAGCASLARAADSGERTPVAFAPTRAVLLLIPGAQAAQALSDHRPAALDSSSAAEVALLRDCADGEPQRSPVSKGFLWSVATTGWRVILHPLAVSIHDELLKYAKVSAASASGDYYRAGDANATTAAVSNRISCLRFTRFAGDAAGEEVALDLVVSVRLDPARDAIRLRPLRLYVSQGAAKSADGHYSLAVAVRAESVWRDEFAGHQGQIFQQTVATESVDLKSGSFLKYYPTEADSGTRVPIVPISFGADRTHDFGRTEFTVSVAELGTQPATLKLLAEMLPDPNQDLSQLVIAAALAGAHLQ